MDISKYAASRAQGVAVATYRFQATDPVTDEPIEGLWFDFRSPDSPPVRAATKENQRRTARFELKWGDARALKAKEVDEYMDARTALIDENFADRIRAAFVRSSPTLVYRASEEAPSVPIDADVMRAMMLDPKYEWLQDALATWYSSSRNFRKPTPVIPPASASEIVPSAPPAPASSPSLGLPELSSN